MHPDSLTQKNKTISQDAIFEFLLLVLSCLHIIYGLFSISMWIMLAILFFVTVISRHFKLSIEGCIKYWWMFTIWEIIGVAYTNDMTYAIGYVLKIVILVFTLSYNIREEKYDSLLIALRTIVFVWISTILLEVAFPSQIGHIRTSLSTSSENWLANIDRAIAMLGTKYGIFSDPAVSAFFCACGVGIGISFLVENKKLKGWGWIVFSAIGIVLTNKRGPMLSVAVSSGILYLLRSSQTIKKKLGRTAVLGTVIALGVFFFIYNDTLSSWFARVNSNIYSNRNRLGLYTTLYQNFINHPFLGSGTKSTRILLNGSDGHNIYLAALSENGVLGLVLLLIAFVSSLKDTVNVMRYEDVYKQSDSSGVITYCLFMQLYIVCYGMTGNPMTTIYSLAMYFMCLGIPLRKYRLLRTKTY